LKKKFLLIVFTFHSAFLVFSKAQNEDVNILFQRFLKLYETGDLVSAEKNLLLILNSKDSLSEGYKVAIYNNLGATNSSLGKYKNALEYYDKAETLISNKQTASVSIGNIYVNKAIIYGFQKSYSSAIEYFEKGIRIFTGIKNPDRSVLQNISSAYLNLGIVYYEIGECTTALRYLNLSAGLKLGKKLTGIALVYLNLAKTYGKTENLLKAEEFYLKSISSFKTEHGNDYFRMAEVYFDYGLFLRSERRNAEALEAHSKALSICLKNYGEKHTFVALSWKHLGDDYLAQADYGRALEFYQRSLIAVVNDFSNNDIYSNPSVDSSLFDIRLLDNLKSKARALELFANEQNDKALKFKTIIKSLETIELALHLIDNIRNNYLTEDSRIYLSDKEKETYLFAVHIASTLYSLTGDIAVKTKIYSIVQKAKSAVLRNEITENDLLYSAAIRDTTREKQNRLSGNIAAYNNLIIEESRKTSPDSIRISLWKDALFDMNREKEEITDQINREFPEYYEPLQKIEPFVLSGIQEHLHRDETIVDYLLSNQYKEGKRELYTLVITKDDFEFRETSLDSLFAKNAGIIRNSFQHPSGINFAEFTGALAYMYENLLKPVRALIAGNKLIIIPDEEIAWLPFDALLVNKPGPDQADYEGLHYLLNDYSVSYSYSSSLSFSKSLRTRKGEEVLSFRPDYIDDNRSAMTLNVLDGAVNEIESIYRWFRGDKFIGNQATESNFRLALQEPAAFHLAMHSISDSTNSRYSYLLFDTQNDTLEDGRLYNYEISLTRMKSPMVVLSACNSGTGTLYHGEGLMSLARGFILSGASSVIRTAWEVNDEVSAAIITKFYYNLSKGKQKNEAMRLAKLEYLKTCPPAYTSPYFWAAYEVLGDNAPIAHRFDTPVLIIITLSVIIIGGILIFYLRRRRIFSERSL